MKKEEVVPLLIQENPMFYDDVGSYFKLYKTFLSEILWKLKRPTNNFCLKCFLCNCVQYFQYDILNSTLASLQAHCKHILTRIKRIYEESHILIGVGELCRSVIISCPKNVYNSIWWKHPHLRETHLQRQVSVRCLAIYVQKLNWMVLI